MCMFSHLIFGLDFTNLNVISWIMPYHIQILEGLYVTFPHIYLTEPLGLFLSDLSLVFWFVKLSVLSWILCDRGVVEWLWFGLSMVYSWNIDSTHSILSCIVYCRLLSCVTGNVHQLMFIVLFVFIHNVQIGQILASLYMVT